MKSVFIIARNTYLEIIRDRILYGLVVFAVFMIGLSLALGRLSFSEQARITFDFGLAAIHLSAIALSIFVGSTLVTKEIDKKTILTLLVRPITRLQFLVGKSLGLIGVNVTVVLSLGVVLTVIFSTFGVELNSAYISALLGILFESMVILGFSIFFSTFSSPIMVGVFGVGIFLIGHWLDSLLFFASKQKDTLFYWVGRGIYSTFPNLEKFNWREVVVYKELVPMSEVVIGFFYALIWLSFLISVSSIVIRNRDFG